jgi:hypothetical protein|tara:strand:+ start:361 stop:633 length:273 start_codon:yes stop_codon:yes gene_type:complete
MKAGVQTMIAFAITCLLVATIIVALLSASDSLLRGARHYRALAGQLRTLRMADGADAKIVASGKRAAPTARICRTDAVRRPAPAGLRTAA